MQTVSPANNLGSWLSDSIGKREKIVISEGSQQGQLHPWAIGDAEELVKCLDQLFLTIKFHRCARYGPI